jgi:hypothetical protein
MVDIEAGYPKLDQPPLRNLQRGCGRPNKLLVAANGLRGQGELELLAYRMHHFIGNLPFGIGRARDGESKENAQHHQHQDE